MAKAEDLTGREFGKIKVLKRAKDRATPSGQKRIFWACECSICGKKREISAQALKRGNYRPCTCITTSVNAKRRNFKICVECRKTFASPPSSKTVTCSIECRKIHAKHRQTGVKRSTETKLKISEKAKERDMSELQPVGTAAAKASPKSGRFITNINAKDWHLISPDGKHYYFRSLNFWLRENCREFFGCEPDSREYINVASGLRNAKRAVLGGKYPCCTYKGWQVIPINN